MEHYKGEGSMNLFALETREQVKQEIQLRRTQAIEDFLRTNAKRSP